MRMYKLEQDIMEELYEENVRSNCGVKRLADTIVNHYFKEYLNEVVEQLEALPNLAKLIDRDDAIAIVKGGAK